MTAPTHQGAIAAAVMQPFALVRAAIEALHRAAQRIDAWLEGRRLAAANRDALACMSDRELLDIGIDRGSVRAVADGRWLRDCLR